MDFIPYVALQTPPIPLSNSLRLLPPQMYSILIFLSRQPHDSPLAFSLTRDLFNPLRVSTDGHTSRTTR
ncbi:hypothetical protein FRC00_010660, partial [Tulasnella sp. 408]